MYTNSTHYYLLKNTSYVELPLRRLPGLFNRSYHDIKIDLNCDDLICCLPTPFFKFRETVAALERLQKAKYSKCLSIADVAQHALQWHATRKRGKSAASHS